MKTTICVIVLGLSVAIVAEKEKKTNKRGTLDELFAYGQGQEAANLDFNGLALKSSLAGGAVVGDSINTGNIAHVQVVPVPEPYDIGATVSRQVTITKNIGVPVAQSVQNIVPVAVHQTVPFEASQSVPVPVEGRVYNRVVLVNVPVGLSVPVHYNLPARQQYAIPVKSTVPVQVIGTPVTTQVYAAAAPAAGAAPSQVYTTVYSSAPEGGHVVASEPTGHVFAPGSVVGSGPLTGPIVASAQVNAPEVASAPAPAHYVSAPHLIPAHISTQSVASQSVAAGPVVSQGPIATLFGASGPHHSSFERQSFRQPTISRSYPKW